MEQKLEEMTLEELIQERDRLGNEMIMAGSPSLFNTSGKCYPCDWGYGEKIKAVNEQIEMVKKVKTMGLRESG